MGGHTVGVALLLNSSSKAVFMVQVAPGAQNVSIFPLAFKSGSALTSAGSLGVVLPWSVPTCQPKLKLGYDSTWLFEPTTSQVICASTRPVALSCFAFTHSLKPSAAFGFQTLVVTMNLPRLALASSLLPLVVQAEKRPRVCGDACAGAGLLPQAVSARQVSKDNNPANVRSGEDGTEGGGKVMASNIPSV